VSVDRSLPDRDTGSIASEDEGWMRRALELAARGLYTATPNPRVGCVIVRAGVELGAGFHERTGAPHAEVDALGDAARRGHEVRGATAYVSLEPCNHTGRTPPCSEALIAAGLARVVMAMRDPNPVAQGGAARLDAAGIATTFGVLESEARELNIGFVARTTRGSPWVRTKLAASLDGRTALLDGTSQWITSDRARADGHAWRARACAIVTGVGTVLTDDPRLTVRHVQTPRQPLRVVVDRHADTPPGAKVLGDGSVIVVTDGARNPAWPRNVETLALPDSRGRIDLAAMLRELGERGINEVHVEAGARLNGALLQAGLIDEAIVYVAPRVLGDPARGMFELPEPLASLTHAVPLYWHSVDRIGPDLRVVARVAAKG